jgi:hypothetical protein
MGCGTSSEAHPGPDQRRKRNGVGSSIPDQYETFGVYLYVFVTNVPVV